MRELTIVIKVSADRSLSADDLAREIRVYVADLRGIRSPVRVDVLRVVTPKDRS